ncbi:metalloprotease, partial [Candidatus Woesearchaeota archaeon]|nr:metalloprotease [Candidatus Woesearchaeota archaeon]
MRFSQREILDLTRAWLLLSIAFAILFTGFSLDARFLVAVVVSGFTAGIGFLLHELAHKYVAQKYNCHAEFHAFDQMLWIAVFLSFFGFIFAAPGAVFIQGRITPRKNGHISIAGPLTNVIIGIVFFI